MQRGHRRSKTKIPTKNHDLLPDFLSRFEPLSTDCDPIYNLAMWKALVTGRLHQQKITKKITLNKIKAVDSYVRSKELMHLMYGKSAI